ncbi:MAG: four-carbon acid sugar kinase family protein [Acidobacteria bacterium]|nr:four-carbon acid sugar kinase family protein [Acidobacteriota bacterium]
MPDGVLVTFYGDDFSGSTDVVEAFATHGLPAVLFLKPPAESDLRRFPGYRAVGVAGISRSQSPEWMQANLPSVFESLTKLGSSFLQYKVCSTFDSSPAVGSIGTATEIGLRATGCPVAPMVVGAPSLRRYVLFGNLFAAVAGEGYRLDRHPTMSRHPITPMAEADLRLHLARQTDLPVGLVDALSLQGGKGRERFAEQASRGARVVLFDTLDSATLREAGDAIWNSRVTPTTFVAGSSGFEYALLAYWESLGWLPPKPAPTNQGPVDRLLVISGSCSPVTAQQIRHALANGFVGISIDVERLTTDEGEFQRALQAGEAVLGQGGSPILHSAVGPDTVVSTEDAEFGRKIGERLGALAAELVRRCGVRRVVVAGGDTSGHAGLALEVDALTMVCPVAPGGPLCRVWSSNPEIDGIEILFKGGQVGEENLFSAVRAGQGRKDVGAPILANPQSKS